MERVGLSSFSKIHDEENKNNVTIDLVTYSFSQIVKNFIGISLTYIPVELKIVADECVFE